MDVGLKDSGIEWIGKMPDNWNISRVFNEYEVVLGKMLTSEPETEDSTEEKYVCSANVKRVGIAGPLKLMWFTPKEKESLLLKKGDLIVAEGGDSGNSAIYDGSLDPCYIQNAVHRIRSFDKTDVSNKFLFYWMCFAKDIGYIDNICNKATISHFTKNKVQMMPIVDVDYCIKKSIVHYLDTKCSRIDRLCAITKEKIQKLKELKQSILTESVTKGLDHNVDLKDSGTDWIGKIPVEWTIDRIKTTCSLKGRIGWQGLKSDEFTDTGPYVITGVDFDSGKINWDSCNHFSEQRFNEDSNIHVKEGDLLITKDGTIGKVAIAENAPEFVSLNSGVMIIRPFKEINRRYLRYVLESSVFWNWYEGSQTGSSTIRHLYQEQFYGFKFPKPPIEIQSDIAKYLDIECSRINNLIYLETKFYEKLTEYKQSIIYEYVTGKKRVPQEV